MQKKKKKNVKRWKKKVSRVLRESNCVLVKGIFLVDKPKKKKKNYTLGTLNSCH